MTCVSVDSLVLSATSQVAVLKQVIETYRPLKPSTCVITKLDEASSLGGVLSVLIAEELHVTYQCTGQRVPEDIMKAQATDLITRSIAMMNRYGRDVEEQRIEQNFGKYAVYHPLGESYEH